MVKETTRSDTNWPFGNFKNETNTIDPINIRQQIANQGGNFERWPAWGKITALNTDYEQYGTNITQRDYFLSTVSIWYYCFGGLGQIFCSVILITIVPQSVAKRDFAKYCVRFLISYIVSFYLILFSAYLNCQGVIHLRILRHPKCDKFSLDNIKW